MTKPKPTPAQQRAIDWLPADGSWRQACWSSSEPSDRTLYRLFCLDLVDRASEHRYRLTPKGVALFHPEPDRAGDSK